MTETAKRLGNIRSIHPIVIVKEMMQIAQQNKYKDYEFVDGNINFPFIDAVSAGSDAGGFVLVLNKSVIKTTDTILIGKGICFDSGGIQSKGDHMEDMFFDKLGAVLTFSYCMSNPDVGGLIFLASNLVGPDSYVPHEIIESRLGKKVFIDHTDAEGRLCLADLIEYAEELNKSARKITIATLTGAAVRFTGDNTFALVHTPDVELKKKIVEFASISEIDLWPAPSHKAYKKALKTKVFGADIASCGNMTGGGSMTAYEFLASFNKKLTHLDIAAMGVQDHNYTGWGIKEIDFIVNS